VPGARANPPKVSVVIPTIGRPGLLRRALESIGNCDPAPAEVIVVDQSADLVSRAVVDAVDLPLARVVACQKPGRGAAVNLGLATASHLNVSITDDDCTVRSDWIAVANRLTQQYPDGIACGRVLPPPGADSRLIPSTITLETPVDYTGQALHGVLYAGNMVCPRETVLDMGGFDERILPSAEDCDFCYRWLRAGRRLRHEPDLVVWHHAWRSPAELERLYVDYYRGNGVFYAKQLAARDLTVLGFLLRDWYAGVRSLAGPIKGVERWADPRRGAIRGIPRGLREGWQLFRRRTGRTAESSA
jgi:GT2 family glycosyltransferase